MSDKNRIIAIRLIDEALQGERPTPHQQDALSRANEANTAAILKIAQIEAAQAMGLPIKYDA